MNRYRIDDLFVRALSLLTAVSLFLFPSVAHARDVNHKFPRTANYWLSWDLTEPQARELAKWDLVILDMEIQARRPDLLRRLREWNPNIVLLVYITPEEIHDRALGLNGYLRQKLAQQIPESWYLRSSAGTRLTWWPHTYLLNAADASPVVNGQRWNQFLPQFVARELLGSELWDGVFYDNAWDSIRYFAGSDIDINGDGQNDGNADELWRLGMRFLYSETRRLTNDRFFIVANGNTRAYSDLLNGAMIENFIPAAWGPSMETYKYNSAVARNTRFNIINANTGNRGGETNYQQMRFGLASTLLADGYYSYDYGDRDHSQTWRYDEYSVDLGAPLGAPTAERGLLAFAPDVWRREFAHGLAIVNSAVAPQEVELGADYEKIHGAQDSRVNDGAIISIASLNGYDGLILLRTFTQLNDVILPNGGFARFFRPDGTRARNGLFLFEEGYKGGDQVARIDLDGNTQRDLLVVSGNKILAWRDDGQPYLAVYPYTANYKGSLRVAVGDLDADRYAEIYAAPSDGYPAPIKVYSLSGDAIKTDWWPFGKSYRGGYTLAVGSLDGGKQNVIVGAGKGVSPKVTIFNESLRPLRSWLAFPSAFRGGVWVAAGDVDGNGRDEVVVGAGPGNQPLIRVFDPFGKLLYKEFAAYRALALPGIQVAAVDVDFDGKAEIVGVSRDIGN